MPRNIKRTLPRGPSFEFVAFTDSSPSPIRRRIELASPQNRDETSARVNEVGECEDNLGTSVQTSSSFVFSERDLTEIFSESDSDCENNEKAPGKSTSYAKRQQSSTKNWENIRGTLLKAVVESECIPCGQLCTNCNVASANFRCLKCGAGNYFCEACVASLHKNVCVFHVVEQWKDGMFLPSPMFKRILNPRPWHSCLASEIKTITAICDDGRRHELGIMSCPCEAFPVSLARLRLWPTCSKNPSIALSFDLLDWMEALLLECQVSLNDFCRALDLRIPRYVKKKDLYHLIIDCFEEYRYMKNELRTLKVMCPERDHGNVCPACPVGDGTLIESFDACFGLPRKKAAGSSVREPLHGGTFFSNQEKVDNFVDSYPTQPKVSKDCNDFKAGDVLRSRTQFKALDETGVFGRACRHGFPKQFVNLKHGERIAYAVWMLKEVVANCHPGTYDIKIMYDIGCLLTKHLQSSGQLDLLSNVTLAVPAFHIYGHIASCQLEFSPRRSDNFGLSDGEQLERLWSYLRRFSKMTKEMRPSHRIDVLSDALLHYGRQCKDTLVSGLLKNWKKSAQCIEASQKNIDDLANKLSVPLTETVIEELANQERQRLCGERTRQDESDTCNDSPISTYVDQLRIFYVLRSNLCTDVLDADEVSAITKKMERLDKELVVLERANGITSRWTPNENNYKKELARKNCQKCTEVYEKIKNVCEERLFLLNLKEKYSEGNALARKLANQVKKSEKNIKRLLVEYNCSQDQLEEETKNRFPNLSFDTIKTHGINIEEHDAGIGSIPSTVKRHAIEMLNLLKRSREEKVLLSAEMRQLFNYYLTDEAKVSSIVNTLSSNDALSKYERGSLALLKAEQKMLRHRVFFIRDSFKDYVDMPDVSYTSLPDVDGMIEHDNDDDDESIHSQSSDSE
ncbi:uncharacterized protein LOC114535157 [Dendronephthya gigantea]|uniref:uncharacterized protein LOC114535157 n=1 Tax=Dendronephthya gigantea TaxID=151771 RepID=UPI00106D2A47|nr:uncharacterized protein LOC114535157 [Dendronephthya gigantea]